MAAKKPNNSGKRQVKKLAQTADIKTNQGSLGVNPEQQHGMIAVAAYYLAEKRGFNGNSSEDDWLQAEKDLDTARSGHK